MSYNKYIDEFNIEDNWKINKTNDAVYATYKTVQEKKTESNISVFLKKATEEYNQIIEAKEYFDYLLYKSKYQSLKTNRKNYLNSDYYAFEFDEDNRIVKATSTYARKPVTGTAHCSKEDNFNIIIGMEIAKRKCNTKILNKRIKDLKKQEDKLQNQITELENKMNAENEKILNEYELKALGNGNAFEVCKLKIDPAEVVLTNE